MMRRVVSVFSIVAAIMFSCAAMRAQDAAVLMRKADSLRLGYRFDDASMSYRQALDTILARVQGQDSVRLSAGDSLLIAEIEGKKILADNGIVMQGFVSEPVVVAHHTFSVKDFFLFYPLPDKSWSPVPNPLDTVGKHYFSRASYVPEGSREIYFSAPDAEGSMNLYRTALEDSLWSVPSLINESVTSSRNEIFPMLSPDGKTLYFASDGLYGVGGYDLYESKWNEELREWEVPVNMGFPYSSPYDDFLYINTPDGKYTVFASNRDCSPDSVCVFVLEYDNMPVRRSIDDVGVLRDLVSLKPGNDPSMMDNGSAVKGDMPENVDTRRYMTKMDEVRALRDTISMYGRSLDEKRSLFAESDDENERSVLTADILKKEARLPFLQDSLDRAVAQLQKIEMEFLFSGVVIDPDKVVAQADREVVGAASNYAFTRMSPGDRPGMEFMEPEVKFDYSFMILPEGRFAEDNTLPSGIVYQIQMFMLASPARVAALKGLSPVFEEKTATGKYIYRVGLFRTYNDVLSQLNKVKRLGFKTAFIAAFHDGKTISVSKARAMEKVAVPEYRIRIVPSGTELPELTVKAIRQASDRDIVRAQEDGRTVFSVGPFNDISAAEKLEAAIKATGIDAVSIEKIGNDHLK